MKNISIGDVDVSRGKKYLIERQNAFTSLWGMKRLTLSEACINSFKRVTVNYVEDINNNLPINGTGAEIK